MSFKKLKSILSPPNFAISLDDSPKWSEVENKLGIVLPSDYKEFIALYGSGNIGNFIMIYCPFAKNDNMNFFFQQNLNKDAYLTLKESFPEDFPYEVYPTNGGILTWGRTENGDTLNWIVNTQGDWAILVDDGSGDYFEYKGSMTGFLHDVLSGSIICPIFPSDFPNKDSKNAFVGLMD
ncbi:SMI1/KNR4 family protein [Lysinibacillus sp. NPDC056185]|uniref:SMI1/KNR4 family protein n=1 Tax=Lysinibacillus sp. NPDC056185 TaxID=3345739 RepID=UPI0039EFD77C